MPTNPIALIKSNFLSAKSKVCFLPDIEACSAKNYVTSVYNELMIYKCMSTYTSLIFDRRVWTLEFESSGVPS